MKTLTIILVAILTIGFGFNSNGATPEGKAKVGLAVGNKAPEIVEAGVDGTPIALSSLE